MESNKQTAAAIDTLLLIKAIRKRKKGPCVKPRLGRRINLGLYETLVQELKPDTEIEYKNLITELTFISTFLFPRLQ